MVLKPGAGNSARVYCTDSKGLKGLTITCCPTARALPGSWIGNGAETRTQASQGKLQLLGQRLVPVVNFEQVKAKVHKTLEILLIGDWNYGTGASHLRALVQVSASPFLISSLRGIWGCCERWPEYMGTCHPSGRPEWNAWQPTGIELVGGKAVTLPFSLLFK